MRAAMQGRLICGCNRAPADCVGSDGDRGDRGFGEEDLRFPWWSSMVSGSCVSGDVVGDCGVTGDTVRGCLVIFSW
mgnify:CR=1 FL=1